MNISPRSPIPFCYEDGNDCFQVPLNDKGSVHATVYAEDYRRVTESYEATHLWYYTPTGGRRRHVVIMTPTGADKRRGLLPVGRLTAEAKPGQRVFYVNNDTLDLRRPNLELREVGGRSTYDAVQRVLDGNHARAQRQAAKDRYQKAPH